MINGIYIYTTIVLAILMVLRFYLIENHRNKLSGKSKEGIFTLINKYKSSLSLVLNILFIIPYPNKYGDSIISKINRITIVIYLMIALHILSIYLIQRS